MATSKTTRRAPGKKARSPRRKAAQLDLRRTPMQARGQATFERILDATAVLLEQGAAEKLTTNLIAKAARVNVATLYQYFPNKQAVLLALFQRQSEARIQLGGSIIAGAGKSQNWRRSIAAAVDAVVKTRRGTPGTVPLRQLMRSSPDLLHHDQEFSHRIAESLAQELRDSGVRAEKATLVSLCAVEALAALLDMWQLDVHADDDRIIDEAKAMLFGYLAPYFEKTPPKRKA